jgi:uncharacterized protein YecE (DUF72 family)
MTAKESPECRIGTSGYQYDHWQPVFYPPQMPRRKWFDYYARQFDTVEINNTFYRLPDAGTFDRWRDQAPPGFRYALKFSRYGTHMKKLKDPEASLEAFLERAERLKAFIGPVLVQLPPHWGADPGRLDAFLDAAPRRRRWTVEFREPDWLCEDIYRVLREHDAALCIHDMLEDHPRLLTAPWTYLRFHGDHYAGAYSHQALTAWAHWIERRLGEGVDVYAYFNNDDQGHAVRNAGDLRRYVLGE